MEQQPVPISDAAAVEESGKPMEQQAVPISDAGAAEEAGELKDPQPVPISDPGVAEAAGKLMGAFSFLFRACQVSKGAKLALPVVLYKVIFKFVYIHEYVSQEPPPPNGIMNTIHERWATISITRVSSISDLGQE